ncbi:MAG: terminase large subunit domain-containing protein [Acidobacteriota bacterium]
MFGFLNTLKIDVKSDGLNRLSMLLPNGSRIVAIPNSSDTVRGFSNVSLVIIDEAAYVRDETYRAVFPFLAASNGKLLLLSTPYGQHGFFYRAVHEPENNFVRYLVRASESGRLTPDFLAMARLELGDSYAQEFECSFTMGDEQIFDRSLIDQALDPIIQAFR